ncbi:hypothetical protein ANCDUO_07058 [Ancylostoma duodenale]|uniref:Uncharacterized protein n=1 Tax=Ancylostoma duodenale TaxID=51022 RepID=A0A0C2GUI8_9BILA|nr:hypothetical protein ANCDUO_07058 [Ancylostoma duodenale]
MDKVYGADRRHLGDNEVAYVEDRVVHTIRGPRYALNDKLRIVTASTNAAVAQFTNSILVIEEFRDIETIRYVSEAPLLDDAPTTPVDMHKVLLSFGDDQRTPFIHCSVCTGAQEV